MWSFLVWTCALLALVGCGKSGLSNEPPNTNDGRVQITGDPPAAGTYAFFSANIFPQCQQCHGAGSLFDLSSYEALLQSGTSNPRHPETSQLYIKLNDGEMPQGGAKLPQADIDSVQQWIAAGAAND